jgi:hypothetical protein
MSLLGRCFERKPRRGRHRGPARRPMAPAGARPSAMVQPKTPVAPFTTAASSERSKIMPASMLKVFGFRFLKSKSRKFISQIFRGSRRSPLPKSPREGGAPRRPIFKYLWLGLKCKLTPLARMECALCPLDPGGNRNYRTNNALIENFQVNRNASMSAARERWGTARCAVRTPQRGVPTSRD